MLPSQHAFSMSEVLDVIRTAPDLLGIPDNIEVRTVLYETADGQLCPYARGLRVGFDPAGDSAFAAGPLRFVSHVGLATSMLSVDVLREFVWTACREPGRGGARDAWGVGTQTLYRQWSDGVGHAPVWKTTLQGSNPNTFPSFPTSGPFASPQHHFLAETLGDAAAQWLDIPGLKTQHRPTLDVDLQIRDCRAFFRSMRLDNNELVIGLARTNTGQLHACARMIDYAGRLHEEWATTKGELLHIPVGAAFRQVRAYLLDDASVTLDSFDETDSAPSLRAEALFPGSTSRNEPELAVALRRGESDTVEMKAWIPPFAGDPKSVELLQSACAFANTRGGVIFVGVTDQLAVVGVHSEIHKLAKRDGKEASAAMDYYVQLIRQRLSDGLSPTVLAEIGWVQFAGHDICRIRVPRSSAGTLHSVYQTGLSYLRKGANNVPATAEEIQARKSG